MKRHTLGLLVCSLPFAALADGRAAFELGTVVVTAARPPIAVVASEQVSSVVTREQMRTHDRVTVGDAVNLLSGVTVSTNSRNEQIVYLRG